MFKVKKLRQLHPLDLLKIISLVLAIAVRDHLKLVYLIKDGQMLKLIEEGVKLEEGIDTFVHSKSQLRNGPEISLLKVLKLVDAHEFVSGIDILSILPLRHSTDRSRLAWSLLIFTADLLLMILLCLD